MTLPADAGRRFFEDASLAEAIAGKPKIDRAKRSVI